MSLAIGSATVVARLAACACGTCAACAPRPVMQAVAVPVAEPATRATGRDSYEPSAAVPPDAGDAGTDGAVPDAQERRGSEAPAGDGRSRTTSAEQAGRDSSGGPQQLTPDERRMVAELQARDREVRAHEAAHQAAGGGYVGGASYSYQQGPDGRQYAIGGEVPVDLSTGGGGPAAVIAKMAQVQAAAMAPADPSPQDFAVAAAAAAIAAAARQQQQEEETQAQQAVAGSDATGRVEDPTGAIAQQEGRGRADEAVRRAIAVSGEEPPASPAVAPEDPAPASSRRGSPALDAYRAVIGGPATGSVIDQHA